MAEEMVHEFRQIYVDEDASERDSNGSPLNEVPLENMTQANVAIDRESTADSGLATSDIAAAEEIVVDLRSHDLSVRVDSTIEASAVREFPVVPDLKSGPPTHSKTSPDTPVQPIGGLAAATAAQRLVKRAVDIAITLMSLVVLAPFMLIIAVIVIATSRGPVLYRSPRVGKDGREFEFWKFRSMYNGAVSDLGDFKALNEQTGPVFKMRRDPRITPLGRFLRKSSIDELPQLFHVVSGKMSLVGPRPAIPQEVEQYDNRARQRLLVNPGITCIWQVSGRSTIDFDTWVDMDLEYIDSWSNLGDLGLLIRTIPAVVGGKGAY